VNKSIKILAGLMILLLVAVGGFTAFVKFYLTEERLKAIIIPQAESALGRDVSIGSIKVSLFSGITVNDFLVKEKNGTDDFIRSKAFVLRYNLAPLLSGSLEISELRLDRPFIRIERDKGGRFNFETLAVLAEEKTPPDADTAPAKAALPVALTLESIRINGARLEVRDALGEIPEIDGSADLSLRVDLAKDLASLTYSGTLGFSVDARHGGLSPRARGEATFDAKVIEYTAVLSLDDQVLTASGRIDGYRKTPSVVLDISSKALSIDRLLALADALPKGTPGEQPTEKKSAGSTASTPGGAVPEGFAIGGTVAVEKTTFKDLAILDFGLDYSLRKGILTVNNLKARAAEGTVSWAAEADLTKTEPPFKGSLTVEGVTLAIIVEGVGPKRAHGTLDGTGNGTFDFSGSGTSWPRLRKTLNLTGNYEIKQLTIRAPVTETVATLLGIPELRETTFDDATGNVRVENGTLYLKSAMHGTDVSADTAGTIGLDGKLDLPVKLRISEGLGKKIKKKATVAKYVINDTGETVLDMKITGTLSNPRPGLDEKAVQKKVEEKITDAAIEKLDEILTKDDNNENGDRKPHPATELLKGIFGK